MITLKIHIDNGTINEIKNCYGKSDYNTVDCVVSDILNRYLNVEYFDLNLAIEDGDYEVCSFCGEKAKKNRMIDINGRNLEEHKICENCGSGTPTLE